ncbi:insulinase family protein [bacterium]|nr:insulinase family protein [bacterium]
MDIEQLTLKNNLKTLFVNQPGATAGTVQIWFRAGSALEKNKEDFGIAHFLEHMFFKGTTKRPSGKIAQDVESFGGDINAFTSFDYTCYYINPPNDKITSAIDILLDMVSDPKFLNSELIPEREVVFEEYRRSVDNPRQFAFGEIIKNSFLGGYSHPILGTEKSIKNFDKKQLQKFRKDFYNLQNAMFVVAGDLKDQKKIVKKIESFKLPSGKKSVLPSFKLKKKDKISIHKKDVKQCLLHLVIESAPYDDRLAPIEDLALAALGHGETSRLYKSMVIEDSLANSSSSSSMFFSDGGAHFIKIAFELESSAKVFSKLQKVFQDLKSGFDEKEIEKIKFQYASSKNFEKESLESFAFTLGHGFAQNGDIHCEEKFIEDVKSAKSSEVSSIFSEILSRDIHMSLQIPNEADKEKIKFEADNFLKELRKSFNKEQDVAGKKFDIKKSKFDPSLNLIEIKKGIFLLHKHNPISPTFACHMYLRGGLAYESASNNGLYHLIGGNLTKGHQDLNYFELKDLLESKSASLSGFSGKNAYGMTMHALSEHSELIFTNAFMSLSRPRFTEEYFNHEMTQAKRALDNREKDPVKICFKKVSEVFFNKHPYSQSVIGSYESLANISNEDMRTTHQDNLSNSKILISYAGSDRLETVLKEIEVGTNSLSERVAPELVFQEIEPLQVDHHHIDFDREQTHIFYGIPSERMDHENQIILKMLTTFLSGLSSELFTKVRDEMGLCYSAQPVDFSALEGGYWGIYMGSGHDKAKLAVEAIKDIISRIAEKGLKKSEFTLIKNMIRGQNLVHIQTHEDYINTHSVSTFQDMGLDYFFKSQEKIEKLSYEHFNKKLKKVLSQKWSLVTVGRS